MALLLFNRGYAFRRFASFRLHFVASVVRMDVQTVHSETTSNVVVSVASPDLPRVDADGHLTTSSAASSVENKVYGSSLDWKVLRSKCHGLSLKMVDYPTTFILQQLRKGGHETYLVGGCVRDLLLGKIPKDFDILTTADPPEIKKKFNKCMIVGKRFPICHVHVKGSVTEVSSFSTSERGGTNSFSKFTTEPQNCDDRDYARWKNCMKRDFTINGLMYDPHKNVIYDYVGAIEDLQMQKVRTVIPAHVSFAEDNARMLRAIRIAARLGFQFNRETARAIQDCSIYIRQLAKTRLMMEMNYMLAYGAAEPSLRLLWRYGLLEFLLPIQAAYFVSQGFKRRDKRANLLLMLFERLDTMVCPNRPCHSSLWVSLFAFHLALADEPQSALVITTFALSVRNGGNIGKAVNKARKISHHVQSVSPEVCDSEENMSDDQVIDKVIKLANELKTALVSMMDEDFVSQAMSKCPQAPFSNLVFITPQTYSKVMNIFNCVGGPSCSQSKKGDTIDYESLLNGGIEEIRYVFAKIVLEAIYLKNSEKKEDNS